MYEMRYIAFIDILGFKSKTCNAVSDSQEFLRIKEILEYTHKLKQENDNNPYSLKTLGMEFSMFSDSIVISYPAFGKGNGFDILINVAHICIEMINQGYIFRGGITIGDLFHEDSVCFGPAMNMAVEMEKRARYPRIIIDPEVLSNDLRYPGIANTRSDEMEFLNVLVKKDQENRMEKSDAYVYILDYLSLNQEFDDFSHYLLFMDAVRKLIITEFGHTFLIDDLNQRKNVQEKYVWLAKYYNDTIKSTIPSYERFQINLETI
ncbi:hypothetical protein H9X90_05340 [Faecalicatena contorta]|uniref:hypothetical protein n=1 Tax=Faecalicatena contorta TaxID=39482 RepID=UPI001961673D|nr:hypothetical protein [Faecalicatena contorta]MBM6685428.1 hypothetical protein [Faecalicatena contorta]MBM6710169.1 hypothetical protein [Faecalicatena contorta]